MQVGHFAGCHAGVVAYLGGVEGASGLGVFGGIAFVSIVRGEAAIDGEGASIEVVPRACAGVGGGDDAFFGLGDLLGGGGFFVGFYWWDGGGGEKADGGGGGDGGGGTEERVMDGSVGGDGDSLEGGDQ
mmetsp:Transcript_1542/g.2993  ORF Transcript_1542/g.2993 Transcript_1542/m.2993 type:complete len:129 (-) Transcript_1542:213-599(-)